MFDIGFWEIVLISVVALFVVGPEEFPTLIRNCGRGLGKFRRFVSSVKSDFDYEIDKAEQLKELVRKEAEIAELHKILEERSGADTAGRQPVAQRDKVVETNESTGSGSDAVTDQGAQKPLPVREPDKHSQ